MTPTLAAPLDPPISSLPLLLLLLLPRCSPLRQLANLQINLPSFKECSSSVMGISYSAAFVLIDDPPNQQLFLPDEDKIIAKTLLHDCKHRAPSIPPRHMHSHYLASIYSPQSVFNQSLFVNGNRGAPKGRWRGNKWRIFSLLNGALEGL